MPERSRPSAMRAVELLDLADRLVEACLARVSASEGHSREQWRTLMLLDEGADVDGDDLPGHTMGEIAARAAVPSPTATRMVDRLVADGLAFRRSDPWDRRRVLVHISPGGHALVARAASELDELIRPLLVDDLSTRPVDVQVLLGRLSAAAGLPPREHTP